MCWHDMASISVYKFCVVVHYAAVEPMGELRWHNPLRNEELVNAALLSQQGPAPRSDPLYFKKLAILVCESHRADRPFSRPS
jgi:hypothetical protein